MTKLTERINLKTAVAGAAVVTISSALFPNAAQAFPFGSIWRPNSTEEIVFDLTEGIDSPTVGTIENAIQNFRVQTASDIVDNPSIVIPDTTRNNLNLDITQSNNAGLDFYNYLFEFDPINVSNTVKASVEEEVDFSLELFYQGLEKVIFSVPSQFGDNGQTFNFNGSLNSLSGFNQLFADVANAGIEEIDFDATFFYRDDQGEITTTEDNVSFKTSSKSVPEPNNSISLFALGFIGGVSYLKRKSIPFRKRNQRLK